MITVLGMWERWEKPVPTERIERRLWKQTIVAFGVKRWSMCGVKGNGVPGMNPSQYIELAGMLAAHPGPKVFMIPPGRSDGSQSLVAYEHPENAIYVFGNGADNLVRHVTQDDDVVSICTPHQADLFGNVALAAVLYDRMAKQ